MTRALEIIIYKLKAGVADAAFEAAGEVLEKQFAEKQKGFVSRTFGRSDEGDWVDVVMWATMDDAHKAAAAAMVSPVCAPIFAMIDERSMRMHHFSIV